MAQQIQINGETIGQQPELEALTGEEYTIVESGDANYKVKTSRLKGQKGDKGDTGNDGPTGATGPQGPAGESGIPSVVDHGTADTTFTLTPNVLHKWGEVATLNLTTGTPTDGVVNEYMAQFVSGTTATVLTLPETVKWIGDNTVEAGKTYQLSIIDNLAVLGGA